VYFILIKHNYIKRPPERSH